MITEEEYEDLRLGDIAYCMYHQKRKKAIYITGDGYGKTLLCGCPFTRFEIEEKCIKKGDLK